MENAGVLLALFLIVAAPHDSIAIESASPKTFRKEFGPVTAVVTVSPGRPVIGDVIELRITLTTEKDVLILSAPALPETQEGVEILDRTPFRQSLLPDGGMTYEATYKLDPALPGRLRFPPGEVTFSDRRPGQDPNAVRRFETPETEVEVTSVLDGPADWSKLMDIRPERRGPIHIPWLWLAALAALAAAAAWFWRRACRVKPEPPVPAHVRAERELEALMRENLLDQGLAVLFVDRLSNILRRYIENRFELRAPERTTEEFYEEMRTSRALNDAQKETVVDFLRRADLIKFAAEGMDRGPAEQMLDAARRFIKQTREVALP